MADVSSLVRPASLGEAKDESSARSVQMKAYLIGKMKDEVIMLARMGVALESAIECSRDQDTYADFNLQWNEFKWALDLAPEFIDIPGPYATWEATCKAIITDDCLPVEMSKWLLNKRLVFGAAAMLIVSTFIMHNCEHTVDDHMLEPFIQRAYPSGGKKATQKTNSDQQTTRYANRAQHIDC